MEGSTTVSTEMLGLLSLPGVVGATSCEVLERITDPGTILRLLGTSQEMRSLVQACVRRLVVPEGQGLRPELIQALPNLRRVEGPILITEPSQVPMVSSRLRGSLHLLIRLSDFPHAHIKQDPGEERRIREIIKSFLSLLRVRLHLYPQSNLYLEFPGVAGFGLRWGLDFLYYQSGYFGLRWDSVQLEELQLIFQALPSIKRFDFYNRVTPLMYFHLYAPQIKRVAQYVVNRGIPEVGITDYHFLYRLMLRSRKKWGRKGPWPIRVLHIIDPDKSESGWAMDIDGVERARPWPSPLQIPGFYVVDPGKLVTVLNTFPYLSSLGVAVENIPIAKGQVPDARLLAQSGPLDPGSLDFTQSSLLSFFSQALQQWNSTSPYGPYQGQLVPYRHYYFQQE